MTIADDDKSVSWISLKWNSLKDRVPEENQHVAAWMPSHDDWYEAIYHTDSGFEILEDEGWFDREETTHWMDWNDIRVIENI